MFVIINVVKCIVEEKGKILFIKEAAGSSWRPGTWSLPGGKFEPRETFLHAIKREMLEETGLQVKPLGLLRIEEILAHLDGNDRLVHHFVFVCRRIDGKLKNPDHHVAEFKWFSQKDLNKISQKDLSEFYYKEVIKLYFKNKKKLNDLSIISIWDQFHNKSFKEWIKGNLRG